MDVGVGLVPTLRFKIVCTHQDEAPTRMTHQHGASKSFPFSPLLFPALMTQCATG